jgi:hypothetical protein
MVTLFTKNSIVKQRVLSALQQPNKLLVSSYSRIHFLRSTVSFNNRLYSSGCGNEEMTEGERKLSDLLNHSALHPTKVNVKDISGNDLTASLYCFNV